VYVVCPAGEGGKPQTGFDSSHFPRRRITLSVSEGTVLRGTSVPALGLCLQKRPLADAQGYPVYRIVAGRAWIAVKKAASRQTAVPSSGQTP
jgi:hypothetical protein